MRRLADEGHEPRGYAADEAGVKGDLSAASKCANKADAAKSEKKLEDAAGKAHQPYRAGHLRNQPGDGDRDRLVECGG